MYTVTLNERDLVALMAAMFLAAPVDEDYVGTWEDRKRNAVSAAQEVLALVEEEVGV